MFAILNHPLPYCAAAIRRERKCVCVFARKIHNASTSSKEIVNPVPYLQRGRTALERGQGGQGEAVANASSRAILPQCRNCKRMQPDATRTNAARRAGGVFLSLDSNYASSSLGGLCCLFAFKICTAPRARHTHVPVCICVSAYIRSRATSVRPVGYVSETRYGCKRDMGLIGKAEERDGRVQGNDFLHHSECSV